MSHSTRAYLVNANGLKGFLKPGPIFLLRKLEQSNELTEVTKYQHIEIQAVILSLETEMNNSEDRLDFLSKEYPCLFIDILKKRG